MLAAALVSVPLGVEAQPRRSRRQRGGAAEQPAPAAETPAAAGQSEGQSGESGAMTFSEEEASQPTPPPAENNAGTSTSTDTGNGGLQLTVPGGEVQAQRHRLSEEIYAVQQIYALRNHRLEINPSANFALNDPFVQHTGFGLTVNYWITNVLGVGLTGVFFQGLSVPSDVNLQVGRSTGLVVPINEYQAAAALNFSYVPLYGKFTVFNRFIFHWDLFLTAGVGIMRTRPIPAVDPEVRTFDWNTRIMFDASLGFRVFVSRSVAITAELRNFIYPELLENTSTNFVETGLENGRVTTTCAQCRRNPNNWTSESVLTDNVMLSVGLTIFLPFSFSYRLPK